MEESPSPEATPDSNLEKEDQQHSPEYKIRQLRTKLAAAERALEQKDAELAHVLQSAESANSAIALLERDRLTGLFSATGFLRRAQAQVDKNPDTEFDMIVFDIEGFTLACEVVGRKAGDKTLRDIATFLLKLPNADECTFARAHSSLHYVLAPQKLHYFDLLKSELDEFFNRRSSFVKLTPKLGICPVSSEESLVKNACTKARIALDSITTEKNKETAFYNQHLLDDLMTQHQIFNHLPKAIERGEIKLYLQSKVDMVTGRTVGAEALVRWAHPNLGFLTPDKFIPLLEREGLIYKIDSYIWEQACAIQKQRVDNGLQKLPISVNVARNDLHEEGLADKLCSLVDRYGLEPADLHLEILERVYAKETSLTEHVITDLRSRGFVIELDDFGTGESSLAMLADMPIDILKLDRHFLGAELNTRRLEVARAIISLANALGLGILAEGVETKEQEDILTSMGCRYAQGYLYCKPQPAAYFATLED